MKTVFPYQKRINFAAYLDRYLQREDAVRRIPSEAELRELARKGVVKARLVLVPVPEGKPVIATVLEVRRKSAPEPTDEMVEALQE